VRVKIGMTATPRELDLEVEDAEGLVRSLQKAVDGGEKILWVVDEEGRRHGLLVDKISYVNVDAESSKPIGFGRD
jgi:hypothetical protein